MKRLLTCLWIGLTPLLATGADEHFVRARDLRNPFCTRVFSNGIPAGPQRVVSSGRDEDLFSTYKDAVQKIMGTGGVCEALGIPVPPHEVIFAPAGELALLATLGRHAVPHESDGGELLQNAFRNAGVLEFVTPGCPTCRSYYSDTTPLSHQISVLFHVVGHNHFAMTAVRNRIRNEDPIVRSLELGQMIKEYSLEYGQDDVRQWYYYVQSLANLQDVVRGTFQSPDFFSKGTGWQRGLSSFSHNPKQPTQSILQFLVENLPSGTPNWKREILRTYEKMERVIGYYVSNKIMNEGWATLMQEIIMGHSEWATDNFNFDQADLLSGVAYPSMSNPYWLGREAWRRLRARFNQTHGVPGETPLARDRRFIAYAEKLIAQYDDYDFLREAFDETWVRQHKLILKRPVEPHEFDHGIPRPKDPKDNWQFKIVSTDPKKVVDWIASHYANKGRFYPSIELLDENAFGRGVVAYRHKISENFGVPLKSLSAAQTLYVLSQIHMKPVSLTTEVVIAKENSGWRQENLFGWRGGGWPPPQPSYELARVRYEVEANGKIHAFKITDFGETPLHEIEEKMQGAIDFYRDEMQGVISETLFESQQRKFEKFAAETLDANMKSAMFLYKHSPTAGGAINIYSDAVSRVLPKKLRLLAAGKLPHRRTKSGGARIRVLPPIPSFQLDPEGLAKVAGSRLSAEAPQARISNQSQPPRPLAAGTNQLILGAATKEDQLGQGNHGEGDIIWGPKPDGGGGGGQGEEGDEPGEAEEGDPALGTGGGDSGVIEVPADVYARILQEQYELPNLRPKPGQDQRKETVRDAGRRGSDGDVLYSRMIKDVLIKGRLSLKKKGILNATDLEVLKEGFALTGQQDYIVNDHDQVPDPDVNVVITVVIDMSGSMHGKPYDTVRQVIENLRLILKSKYKSIKFRIVGMSGHAQEFSEHDWFKHFMGGGTEYAIGLKKAQEILAEYPTNKWDKILLVAGDGWELNMERAVQLLEEMMPQLQYNAFIHSKVYGDFGDDVFIRYYKGKLNTDPYVGYADFAQEPSPVKRVMDMLFGKKNK